MAVQAHIKVRGCDFTLSVRVRSLLSEELLDDPEIDVVYNPVHCILTIMDNRSKPCCIIAAQRPPL